MIEKKVVLITGGTSGIGAETAKVVSKKGFYVVVTGRNEERGNAVVNEIKQTGGNSEFCFLDLTDKTSVKKIYTHIESSLGRLDALFNNAGIFPVMASNFEDLEEDDWQNVFDTNVTGHFRIIKTFLPLLKENHGVIVNNASIAGIRGSLAGRQYAYGCSKAAVIQMSQMLAKNYAKDIRVNCICPGIVATPIFTNPDLSRYNSVIPLGRVAQPEDIGNIVAFLFSEEASYLNGAVIPIDGGQSI